MYTSANERVSMEMNKEEMEKNGVLTHYTNVVGMVLSLSGCWCFFCRVDVHSPAYTQHVHLII